MLPREFLYSNTRVPRYLDRATIDLSLQVSNIAPHHICYITPNTGRFSVVACVFLRRPLRTRSPLQFSDAIVSLCGSRGRSVSVRTAGAGGVRLAALGCVTAAIPIATTAAGPAAVSIPCTTEIMLSSTSRRTQCLHFRPPL